MNLSENATKALIKRYFIKDKNGKVTENWEKLCRRVIDAILKDEKNPEKYKDDYYDMMYNLRFLPNSPTLMNAGRPMGQLSACFVLPVGDSMEEIFEANKNAALIHKSGGGTGFSFSKLRPKNSIVASTSGVASGPVSFMKVFNASTEAVKQGGTRRGANMAILRVDHPDILEFIDCKQDLSEMNNFNISVAITDKFMEALKNNVTYELINPKDNTVVSKLSAKLVFNKIVYNAWKTGEPGVFFIDKANKFNKWGVINATNPCGEQPIRDNESCNLGSINLSAYIMDNGEFNWDLYNKDICLATRFLDSVISVNCYPLDIIKQTHLETRKIGLGVMGFADALIKQGISYGSKEAEDFADRVYSYLNNVSKVTSTLLSKEKGSCIACKETNLERRNYWTTTIAPTGTISIIAGCSSGIEPIFAVAYIRNILDGEKLIEFNPIFKKMMEDNGIEITKKLEKEIITKGSIQNIPEIPDNIKKIFLTASDITPEQHIKIQSIFQKYSDSGVSKTINMDESATEKDVYDAYVMAYNLGCKGVTVYRNNSRANQPMANLKEEKSRKVYNRVAKMSGTTEKVKTNLGNLLLTINEHVYGEPGELILNIGKSGADISGLCECIGRLVSIGLQFGIPANKIAEQMIDIKGDDVIIHDNSKFLSIPDLVGRRLMLTTKEKIKDKDIILEECPICHNRLYRAEGCKTCICGYSKC